MTVAGVHSGRVRPALLAGRAAALLGVAGSLGHLLLAAEHTHHSPVLTAGMLLLAVVCAHCSVQLWRRPADPAAWRDLLILAAVMTALHFLAGGLSAAFLSLPLLQLALASLAFLVRGTAAPADTAAPASVPGLPGAPPATRHTGPAAGSSR